MTLSDQVFLDLFAYRFKPRERDLLLLVWHRSLRLGRPAADMPEGFGCYTGTRNPEAQTILAAPARDLVLQADWGRMNFALIPQSDTHRWLRERRVPQLLNAPATAPAQSYLPQVGDRPLDEALLAVATAEATKISAPQKISWQPKISADPPSDQLANKLQLDPERKLQLKAKAEGLLVEFHRLAQPGQWHAFERDWRRLCEDTPDKAAGLLAFFRSRPKDLAPVTNPLAFLSRIARDEGYYPERKPSS